MTGKVKDRGTREVRADESKSAIADLESRLAKDSLWQQYMQSKFFKGKVDSTLGKLLYTDTVGMPHLLVVDVVTPSNDVKHGKRSLHTEELLTIYRKIANEGSSSYSEAETEAIYSIMLKAGFSKYEQLVAVSKDIVSVFNKEVPAEYLRKYAVATEPC